jgi:hypothetical protein
MLDLWEHNRDIAARPQAGEGAELPGFSICIGNGDLE